MPAKHEKYILLLQNVISHTYNPSLKPNARFWETQDILLTMRIY